MGDMEHDCTQCGAIHAEHIATVACGNSCRECGKYSYFAHEVSYLYLLTNQQLQLHKIGIGTAGKDKDHVQQLIRDGWSVHGLWHTSDKGKTFKWEKEIFSQLKARFGSGDAPGFIGRSDKHWVESISAPAISITVLAQLMSTVVSGTVK